MHDNKGMFAVIGRNLERLTSNLRVIALLCQEDKRSAKVARQIHETCSRVIVEERMLRNRFDLPASAKPRREEELLPPKVSAKKRPREIHGLLRSCQELSRSLEEYFSFFNMLHISRFFRKLRYDLYGYERGIVSIFGPIAPEPAPGEEDNGKAEDAKQSPVARALRECPLYFILDESLTTHRDPLRIAFDAVNGGVRIMQLRMKEKSSRQLLEITSKLKPLCAEHNCLLIVNDRVDIALLAGADGVHVGEHDLSPGEVRKLGPDLIIGATARTVQNAMTAQAADVDYVGSGSVFPSSTKPGLPVIGARGLKRITDAVYIPVVGIGGITLTNCAKVIDAGAQGFCSVKPFISRRSVKNLAAEFRKLGRAAQG